MLKLLLASFFAALLLLAALPTALVLCGLETVPRVQPSPSARQSDVERIRTLLHENDPRELSDGEVRTMSVSQRDLNIALRSLMPAVDRQHARASVAEDLLTLHYTLELPPNPLGPYFNLSLLIAGNGRELAIDSIRSGDLSLPGWTLAPLLFVGERLLVHRFPEFLNARSALQDLSLTPGEISVTYRWDRDLAEKLEDRSREVFLPAADRERALAYYRILSAVSHRSPARASLAELLGPLFRTARERSLYGDAAAENRALLLVLGTVLNRSSMHRLVGGDPADLGPGHYYVRWTLDGRHDLAQHFGISAAIAAAGGSVLADAIGAYKELDDSRGGSGFSFADLLADRAGVELAVAATGPEANQVQRMMAMETLVESDFIPSLVDLPEGLMEMEFNHRYRDLDDARYGHVKREIDTRVASLPLHRR